MQHANLPDAGRIPHALIDRRLPTTKQKNTLLDLDSSVFPLATSNANTSNPPTDAQLDSAFGTPATVGAGFVGILDDNAAGTAVYLCYSDGSAWWTIAFTLAV